MPVKIITFIFGLALCFAVTTLWALERGEVAIVTTSDASGAQRNTRVWVAEDGGLLWLEANNPHTPWYLDVLERPAVELRRGDASTPYRAVPQPGDEGHAHVRQLMRAKYGLADRWIELVAGDPRSVAVRLDPAADNTSP